MLNAFYEEWIIDSKRWRDNFWICGWGFDVFL